MQAALGWSEALWPWQNYGPVAMAAVRAGVPVLGGNLPRRQLRTAQTDTSLEALLGPAALERQRQAVRDGHCGLLPESRVPGMARIQVARDQSTRVRHFDPIFRPRWDSGVMQINYLHALMRLFPSFCVVPICT